MWESPINAIYEAQQNAFDGAVLSAVMKVGIDVDKEELIKALAYDRRQYEKGYADAKAEIVRCKDCKHWTQSMGKMKGYGLGRCDFHDADLVTCNGYCYWAERRTDDKTNKGSSC